MSEEDEDCFLPPPKPLSETGIEGEGIGKKKKCGCGEGWEEREREERKLNG